MMTLVAAWMLSSGHATVVDRIAAVVNDDVVTLSEVYDLGGGFILQRCPDSDESCLLDAELEILDVQIRRTLIRQELLRLDLQITAADVDRAIDDTVREYAQIPDRAALRREVESQGQRWDQYREELFEYLRTQAFQGRVLAPRVTVNDDEVRDRYQREARKTTLRTATVTGLGMKVAEPAVLESVMVKALQVAGQVNEGSLPWEEAQEAYDDAEVSLMFGREVNEGELVEQFNQPVFQGDAGVVRAPILLNDIVFLLRVESFGTRQLVTSFEDAENSVRNMLFQEKLQEAEEEWYQRARREAAIDIKLK